MWAFLKSVFGVKAIAAPEKKDDPTPKALVKTFTSDIHITRTVGRDVYGQDEKQTEKGTLYFHLFEYETGRRACVMASTLRIDEETLDRSAKRFNIYQEKIYRWLHGRYDPDIPSYSSIPEQETANALRGTIE